MNKFLKILASIAFMTTYMQAADTKVKSDPYGVSAQVPKLSINGNQKEVVPNSYIVVLKERASISTKSGSSKSRSESVRQTALRLLDEVQAKGSARAKSSSAGIASSNNNLGRVYSHVIRGFSATLTPEQKVKLEMKPEVESVKENYIIRLDPMESEKSKSNTSTATSTTSSSDEINWGLDRINQTYLPLDNNYETDATGDTVHAYIIDTGINPNHEEFTGRIGDGYDVFNQDNDPNDENGHGTHVAGTVGGTKQGVAKNVVIHAVKIFGQGETTSKEIIIAGLDWVLEHHQSPAVVNMSIGGPTDSDENNAVKRLTDAGIIVVVAAGNESSDACNASPAAAPSAITVAASDSSDYSASFTNYGSCVDLYAPGVSILSAKYDTNDQYISYNGTSMASPHAAGVAALYLEKHPSASSSEVHDYVVKNTTKQTIQGVPTSTTANKLLYSLENSSLEALSFELDMSANQSKTVDIEVQHAHDNVSYEIIKNPTHGNLSINGTIVTYTPNHDYEGDDAFEYKASNSTGSDIGTVTIHIFDNSIPTSKEQLRQMILNGDDVTEVNTSLITDMSYLLVDIQDFNQDISGWDTSNVTNMEQMFSRCVTFNQPIGDWNVSRVRNMSGMFNRASAFNQNLAKWDTSSVINMRAMFNEMNYNQPIGDWNTSNVTDMQSMFQWNNFNQPINNWDTSNVTNMSAMFNLSGFNQALDDWDTSKVTSMRLMFANSPFNQDISKWHIEKVTNHDSFSYGSPLTKCHNPFEADDTCMDPNGIARFISPQLTTNPITTIYGTRITYEWNLNGANSVHLKVISGSGQTIFSEIISDTSYTLEGLEPTSSSPVTAILSSLDNDNKSFGGEQLHAWVAPLVVPPIYFLNLIDITSTRMTLVAILEDEHNNYDGINFYKGTELIGTMDAVDGQKYYRYTVTGLTANTKYEFSSSAYTENVESTKVTRTITTPGDTTSGTPDSAWRIYDNTPSGAKIELTYDDDKEKNVVELTSTGRKNGFMIGNWGSKQGAWNDRSHNSLQWDEKFDEDYIFYARIMTTKGTRYLRYSNYGTRSGKRGKYIYIKLDKETADGEWHTIKRNLSDDLKRFEPDNSLVAIHALSVRGSGMIDAIQRYTSQ